MRKFIQDPRRWLYTISVIMGMLFLGCKQEEYLQPQKKNIIDVVFASGHIATEDQYNIISAVDGYIQASSIKEGMMVPDDFILARIEQDVSAAQLSDAQAGYKTARQDIDPNSPKILELDTKIEVAEKELAQNKRLLESYERLVSTNAVSKVDYENQLLLTQRSEKDLAVLHQSKADLLRSLELNLTNADNLLKIRKDDIAKYQLRSKGESQVLKTYHEEGEFIRRGETFAEMGRGKPIVKLFVEEADINSIRTGQLVEVSINTYRGKLFKAEVIHIYPAFDEAQQSFIVDAQFLEQPDQLFAGTQLQANIIIAQKEEALVIPTACLVSEDEVILRDKGLQKVRIGIRNTEWVEVLEGISVSDYLKVNIQG